MSDPISVYGTCKFRGSHEEVLQLIEKWEFSDLLIPLTNGEFILDGTYKPSSNGPYGLDYDEDLHECLNEIAKAVTIVNAGFRCYGPEPGEVWDFIHIANQFLKVPLELQPTLEALDDPAVRDHYGLDYCVSENVA